MPASLLLLRSPISPSSRRTVAGRCNPDAATVAPTIFFSSFPPGSAVGHPCLFALFVLFMPPSRVTGDDGRLSPPPSRGRTPPPRPLAAPTFLFPPQIEAKCVGR
uniref:Uncharacterized protein n=1 Tax=Opuntia streptacantha TaxID=393608 RepID=A0A7C8YWE1_OPUST